MRLWTIAAIMMVGALAWAKPAPELVSALEQAFAPADFHKGLVSSQENLESAKLRGYAVIKKSGIPASHAVWFISHQDYEFRPLTITDTAAKTHFGSVDVTLDPGTVMLVVDTVVQGHTVNIRLLSTDVVVPKDVKLTSRHTRAGVSLVFKFPKLQMQASDAPAILERIEEYVMPASSLAQAEQIAMQVRGGVPVKSAAMPAAKPVEKVAPQPIAVIAPPPVPAKAPAIAPAPKVAATTPSVAPAGVVQTGMEMGEVRKIKGEPKHILNRGDRKSVV